MPNSGTLSSLNLCSTSLLFYWVLNSRFAIQHRASIRLTRSEILDLPSSSPAVKPEVRARLDEIAAQTAVRIAVVNSSQSASLALPESIASDGLWTGLETERICELAISGSGIDLVDVARVRLLVMLDELVRC